MDAVIMGALFDFACELSQRRNTMVVGEGAVCSDLLIHEVKAFATNRGLNTTTVDANWNNTRDNVTPTLGQLLHQVGDRLENMADLVQDALDERR